MPWSSQSRRKFEPTTMTGNQAKLGYQLPFTCSHHHSPNLSPAVDDKADFVPFDPIAW